VRNRHEDGLVKTIDLASGLVPALFVMSGAAHAQFSVDRTSPEVPTVSSADVLLPGAGAPMVAVPATALGMPAGAAPCTGLAGGQCEIDALSDGTDAIVSVSASFSVDLWYSVDRAATGAGGSAVATQATVPPQNGAAGDLFRIEIQSGSPGTPALFADATISTLTPAPTVAGQSDLDAALSPALTGPVYFSVDPATAAALGRSAADILLVTTPGSSSVWANAAALGLMASDDIDALAVKDPGPSHAFGASDVVYISLAPGSPSLAAGTLLAGGAAPGDVIQVSPAPAKLVVSAASLGLAATDNLNALLTIDNNGSMVPALGTWGLGALLLVLSVVGVFVVRRPPGAA
jgi:hypothetical protein